MHTKWCLTQPETPIEIVASPSDSYDESLRNKRSNVIESKSIYVLTILCSQVNLSIGMKKKMRFDRIPCIPLVV